jgi:hypothetical protein
MDEVADIAELGDLSFVTPLVIQQIQQKEKEDEKRKRNVRAERA